jgi:hypothetical protein
MGPVVTRKRLRLQVRPLGLLLQPLFQMLSAETKEDIWQFATKGMADFTSYEEDALRS